MESSEPIIDLTADSQAASATVRSRPRSRPADDRGTRDLSSSTTSRGPTRAVPFAILSGDDSFHAGPSRLPSAAPATSSRRQALVLPGQPFASSSTGTSAPSRSASGDVQITNVVRRSIPTNVSLTEGMAPGPHANPTAPTPQPSARSVALSAALLALQQNASHRRLGSAAPLPLPRPTIPAAGAASASTPGSSTSATTERYIRKQYKTKYTHPRPSQAPFSDSVIPPPIAVDGGTGRPLEDLQTNDSSTALGNGPICAGCDKALQMESAGEDKWLWALPCGHVIDGECRDRLAGQGAYAGQGVMRKRFTSSYQSIGEEIPQRQQRGKRPLVGVFSQDSDDLHINMVRVSGNRSKRLRTDVADTSVEFVKEDGSSNKRAKHGASTGGSELITCPVESCNGDWRYSTDQYLAAVRLFV